jgi:hypothetical protein
MSATAGTFSLAGSPISAVISRMLSAGAGNFVVAGQAAQLTSSVTVLVSAVFSLAVQFALVQDVCAQWSAIQQQTPQFVYVQSSGEVW